MATWTLPPVLAGIDGSPDSMAAADVAAVEAWRRDLPLRLVVSHPHPPVHGGVAPIGWRTPDTTRQVIDRDVQRIRGRWPKLDVVSDPPGRDLVDTLVEQSRDAALLVVGAQRLGGYDSLLGRWLNDRAVSVHSVGPRATDDVDDTHCYGASTAQAQAADLVAQALAGWTDRYPQLDVIRQPMYAPDVAVALVDASAAADLVVVGCRGRSAITSLRLGSGSRALVQHAHCPVLVAHAYGDRRPSNEPVTVGRGAVSGVDHVIGLTDRSIQCAGSLPICGRAELARSS
jgi:nucleotide-binding universal stress UspA family protein